MNGTRVILAMLFRFCVSLPLMLVMMAVSTIAYCSGVLARAFGKGCDFVNCECAVTVDLLRRASAAIEGEIEEEE